MKATVYTPELTCSDELADHIRCIFTGYESVTKGISYSVNMLRIFMYKQWAMKYDKEAIIMLSDANDVVFQSNPFNYQPKHWAPPRYQLTVFQEAYPNKMIYRCGFNSGWIESCYGTEALNSVKHNPVSCSGTVMGSRDGVLVLVSILIYVMVQISVIDRVLHWYIVYDI